jgi:hypothetical protein
MSTVAEHPAPPPAPLAAGSEPPQDPPRSAAVPRARAPGGPSPIVWARVTLALVVAALIGVIALPDRTAPRTGAHEGDPEAALAVLAGFRAAVEGYRIDHGEWPGWDPAGGLGPRSACAERLGRQLALPTDVAGESGSEPGTDHPLGPYLEGGPPVNPLNGLSTVRVLEPGEPWPLAADDGTGWIYDPRSGLLKLNSPGRPAGSEVRYFDR